MTTKDTEAAVIAELGALAAETTQLEPGRLYLVQAGAQQLLSTWDFADHPPRKRGRQTVLDLPSFVSQWNKHSDPYRSEIWAFPKTHRIVATFDAHSAEGSGWGEHTLTFQLTETESLTAWKTISGRQLSHAAFAEFLDEHCRDVITPSSADLLEVAQTFHATTNVQFESSKRLANGEVQLSYRETIEAKAGRRGDIGIPQQITLQFPLFDGLEPTQITARFRFRIIDGDLFIIIHLNDLDTLTTAAFNTITNQVTQTTGELPLVGQD